MTTSPAWWEISRRRRWFWCILLEPPWHLVWGPSTSGSRQVELYQTAERMIVRVPGLLDSQDAPQNLSGTDHLAESSPSSAGHPLVREVTNNRGEESELFSLLYHNMTTPSPPIIATSSQPPPSSPALSPFSSCGREGEISR